MAAKNHLSRRRGADYRAGNQPVSFRTGTTEVATVTEGEYPAAKHPSPMNQSLITRATAAPVESVAQNLPMIAARHGFGVLGVHDLKQKMNSKGVPFDRACLVFEVCNPQQAQVILTANISVSAALPCRISVYSEAERTVLATLEPAALLSLFGTPPAGTETVAAAVRRELVQIMDEVCAVN